MRLVPVVCCVAFTMSAYAQPERARDPAIDVDMGAYAADGGAVTPDTSGRRATLPPADAPTADAGVRSPGTAQWNDVRPHGTDAKYQQARAAAANATSPPAPAGDKALKWKFADGGSLELYQGAQIWSTYSMNVRNGPGTLVLAPIDDRADLFIRRGRLGVRGNISALHSFNLTLAYDGLGKDVNNAVRGGNNATGQLFFVWDAMWTFHLQPTFANVTIGHFRPQIGRESITGAFAVNSFEKAATQSYTRAHIVGKTNGGREAGVNIGGLFNGAGWGVNYNFGIFDTSHTSHVGPAARRWFPLLAGRVALTLGDPEMPKCAMGYAVNYFGKRTGITVAVQGTTQGQTDTFTANNLVGFDVLANIAGLSVTAELHRMGRNVFGARSLTHAGHVRAGYTFGLGSILLEPSVMYMEARGASTATTFTGRDRLLDVTLNWYVHKNALKLNATYSKNLVTLADGGTSEFTDGRRFVRGDFVGLGVQLLY